MNKLMGRVLMIGAIAMVALAAHAQEVKEKPPMYSYVANWAIPRAQWGEMDKATATDRALMDKNIASGTIVGYGNDTNLIHQADGETHDDWWSGMSMAAVLNVLDQSYKNGTATSPVFTAATKHFDGLYVSTYYNWQPGTWKDVYTHVGMYKLKESAPEDAVDTLAKNLIVPLLEKLLSDGTIHEYEIDLEAIHTHPPNTFSILYIAANAEALDKVNAAIRGAMKASPLGGPAFDAVTDGSGHRDELLRSTATFK
ncbi:MAG TPA: hypothetical protein VH088_11700 [Terriglobales bacterium]|jgi:hypothetical protein|nr:hypothetical protein [Terriglobales bacterium]